LESHGGYLLRLESFDGVDLVRLAREALSEEGVAEDVECGLLVSLSPRRKVIRVAFDAAFAYGRKGAQWYAAHHLLASRLSHELQVTVHAYSFDAEHCEEVIAFGNGRRVGGERVIYEDVELPETDDGELDERAFEHLKSRWPLGHLAYVFGLTRDELLRLPRAASVLLDLASSNAQAELARLLPPQEKSA